MSKLCKLTDRILARLGLDLDFSISTERRLFDAITEDLYLGARPDPAHVPTLADAGITHVVSCLHETQRADVAFLREHFEPLFLPVHDGIGEDIASVFPTLFDFADAARQHHPHAKILVHCEVGVSRSATLATALVMRRCSKRFFEAYCDVRDRRRGALPNIGFASQLQRLEHDLHPRTEDPPAISSLARYLQEVCTTPAQLQTLEDMLRQHDYDAPRALQAIFGDEIPRVVQGVRR